MVEPSVGARPYAIRMGTWLHAQNCLSAETSQYKSNQSIHDVSQRYIGHVKCMDMAVDTCRAHSKAIIKREEACGESVGPIPLKQLEDARGWWRLVEIARAADGLDDYVDQDTCKQNVEMLDNKIEAAKKAMQ